MAKKKTIIINKKTGEITIDYDGFGGKTCLEDAEKFFAALKNLGVETQIQDIQPKEDNKVQEDAGIKIAEGE